MRADRIFLLGICVLAHRSAWALPGDVLRRTKAPAHCVTGLVWDGKTYWVADHKTDLLYRLDTSGRVTKTLPAPGHRPAGLAWDGRFLWNVDEVYRKIYKIDPRSGLVVHRMDSPVAAPRALAWSREGLWLSDRATRTIKLIDPVDGTTIRSIPAPDRSVEGLAFDGKYLFAADRLSDKIYMLEPKKGEVIFSFASPGPYPTGIAYDGKHLVVADYERDDLAWVVRRDSGRIRRKLVRKQRVSFTYQVRHFGPGALERLQVFLGVPHDEEGQRFLLGPTFFGSGIRPKFEKEAGGMKVALFDFRNLGQRKTVTVGWRARVALYDVQHYVFPDRIRPLGAIPARIRALYLKDGRKYLLRDPVIRAAVRRAVGRQRNPYWMARRIYRYIHEKMHYELAGGWNTAPRVLSRGSGSCSEYTFVFIALCRAAGIPARYVGSVVVRRDAASFDDVFHRWAEIYLPGHGWLPVDASRGDKPTQAARGDAFGHVTADFVITTRSPGPSRFLDWTYNGAARWTCRGRCHVEEESIAEWEPIR